ncbi:TPA: hypothetical protein ACFJEL_002276, partial [Neisseria gonorrhoeae]
PMPSEPSDGIFDRPPFTGAGRAWKYPNRHSRQYRNLETRPTTPQSRNPSDNTAISKPVIPAQAGIRTCPHGNLSDKTVAQTPRPRFPLPWE